jgi:PLP dependent protein
MLVGLDQLDRGASAGDQLPEHQLRYDEDGGHQAKDQQGKLELGVHRVDHPGWFENQAIEGHPEYNSQRHRLRHPGRRLILIDLRPGKRMNSDRIRENLASVLDGVAAAAHHSGRQPSSVALVAVTKKNSPELIRLLVAAGALELGENYPQELWSKFEALADLPSRWHLIGHLQGNKAKKTLPMVKMIHAVDSLKLLKTLDDLAANLAEPPSVCLQVNASGEDSKHGWSPSELPRDADAIAACRRIPIVGLMTIAGYGTSNDEARPTFARLRVLRDQLRTATGLPLPELSMGMSGDYQAAIEEGATWVRVGSALFEGAIG